MKIKITGLDELQRELERLQHAADSISGTQSIPVTTLLSSEFMLLNTDFESVQAMFDASGFTINSQADFDAIPEEEWDSFIRQHTRFGSWSEMLAVAGEEYFGRRLRGEG